MKDFVRITLLASLVGLGCSASDDASSQAPEAQPTGTGSTPATGAPAPGERGAPGAVGPAGRDGHQRVFGDGSAGALEITKDTVFDDQTPADGNLAFTSIHIAAGATLTVPSGTVLRATGNVDIEGKLVVLPFASSNRYGGNTAMGIGMIGRPACESSTYHAAGTVSFEPRGGDGIGAAAARYGLPTIGAMGGGSGCGYGSSTKGGGRITIAAGAALTVGATGAINADGESAYSQSQNLGGGGGGFVILGSGSSILVQGSVSARGGSSTKTIIDNPHILFGGGGGGGGGILFFAPVVETASASFNVEGGVAPALPIIPNFLSMPFLRGGGGGGAVGDGGSGAFIDGYGDRLHNARSGEPGAVLTQKTHPANSSLF